MQTDTRLASEVKSLLLSGNRKAACERFEVLIDLHQNRAARIAYYYLRDPADVDEAVQDAFVKAFLHLPAFREELLFELWLTKILVNGCIDRLKARTRRARWFLPTSDKEREMLERRHFSQDPSPEATVLASEKGECLRAAIDTLPKRQRSVVVLSQLEGHTTLEVSDMLGLTESTVRVHLFRAIRALRKKLSTGGQPEIQNTNHEVSSL